MARAERDSVIIRHPGRSHARGKSSLRDLEKEIDDYRSNDLGGAERTPVPPEVPCGAQLQPRQSTKHLDLEAKIDQYREEMTQQDLGRSKEKAKIARSTSKHASAGMEPHSERKAAAPPAGHSRLSIEVPRTPRPRGVLGKTSSNHRITLAVTPIGTGAVDKPEPQDQHEHHVLPQELLGYRDPAAALFRIALSTLRRLEAKGMVRKALRKLQKIDSEQGTAQEKHRLHGLLQLVLATVGHEPAFDDFEQLVSTGGVSEALQHANGQLPSRLARKLLVQLRELVGSGVHSKDSLGKLLAMHDKSPTVTTSIGCWLYGKLLEAEPENYSLTSGQREVWQFFKLQPSLRKQDRRLSKCEAWAREQVDVLRHLPSSTLRDILMAASCTTVNAGQRVLRVGERNGVIFIIFAGSLSAMVAGLDAHEHAKLIASQVVHTITSHSAAVMQSQMDTARLAKADSASEWMRKWQEALAKNAANRWATKFRVRKAREKSKEKVPLVIGPCVAIGQRAAISYAKYVVASQSLDHTVSSNARNLEVKSLTTAVNANQTTLMVQIEDPRHVMAIEQAMEADRNWKFEKLFAFEGLRSCSCDVLQDLAQRVSLEVVREGETLFNIGDPASELFFVVSGALEVTVPRSDGTVNRIATVGSGATFGSFPELLAARKATVLAIADAEVLSVHLYNFHNAMASLPDVIITDYGTADQFHILRSQVQRSENSSQFAEIVEEATKIKGGTVLARPSTSVQTARADLPGRPSTSGGLASDRLSQRMNVYSAGGSGSCMAQTARLPSTRGVASTPSKATGERATSPRRVLCPQEVVVELFLG